MHPVERSRQVWITVLVAALGYFVDIYDLVLFSIVRVSSLRGIGVPETQLLDVGVYLLNMQMAGMLIGGLIWGILGDKRGRVSVLFGSIFLYSIANLGNAFVTSQGGYAIARLFAGIGLAGELGAAITLVAEIMSKEKRGYGTAIVASVGICGAVAAALVGETFDWKVAYIVGGLLGFMLLFLRISICESGMFLAAKRKSSRRGDLRVLFSSWDKALRYVSSSIIGVPIWFVIGILVTFSPELAREIGVTGPISAGTAILFCYVGLVGGDLASGVFSQVFRSRKKITLAFLILTLASVVLYAHSPPVTPQIFYLYCVIMGFSIGYWAILVTMAAEQFGTNLRATVATTTPNFVRGAVVPLTLAFRGLGQHVSLLQSALWVGLACIFSAFIALRFLDETYGKELNYED